MKKKFIIPTIGIIETTDQLLLTNASFVMGGDNQTNTKNTDDSSTIPGAKESSFSLDF